MNKLAIAKDAWGDALPDWIAELAKACDASSQNAVARKTGLSATTISNVCRNAYGADMTNVEETVRGVLMRETVDCPANGEIPKHECRKWRDRASAEMVFVNNQTVVMRRACTRCPIFKESQA